MSIFKYKWLKITTIVVVSVVFLFVLLPTGMTAFLSSDRMRPKINKICSSFVPKGEIVMDTVSISLYDEFPCLSLELSNGYIKSKVFENDSLNLLYGEIVPEDAFNLLRFDKLIISVNIPQLIFGKINIRGLQLDGTNIYAYISPWGKANWDIFGEDDGEDDEEESSGQLNLNANKVSVRNTHLIFDDSKKQNSFEATIGDFYAGGKIALDFNELVIDRVKMDRSDFVLYMEESQSLAEVHIDSVLFAHKEDDLYNIAFVSKSNLMMQSKVY